MFRPRPSRIRRSIAVVAVAAAHVLVALLMLASLRGGAGAIPADASVHTVMVWVDDVAQIAPAASPDDSFASARPNSAARRPRRPAASQPAAAAAAPAASARDWYGAIESVAPSSAATAARRGFGQQPVSPLRPCKPQGKPFAWNPEPQRAGLAGGLPYVRVGRCIVGLGFFGCRVGEAPPANGRLLDEMKNAPVAAGSVPDERDCAR